MSRHNIHGQPIGAPLDIALPRPRPEHCTLSGRTCQVVPLRAAHGPALHAAFGDDPAGYTYLPENPPRDAAETCGFVAQAAQSRDPLFFAICAPDGAPLGHASYLRITPEHGVIEVGYIHFSSALRGTALASEAMYLMMAHVFDDLGYRRYEWKCDALNGPSRAAAARLGFTFEGIFRQATTYKGRNRDTAWFSLLAHEWPATKAAFQRWLAPSNFDPAGRQITALTTPGRAQTIQCKPGVL